MSTHTISKWIILPLLLTAYGSLVPSSPGQVPSLINYQGRLVDNGAPVNGDVKLVLRLYGVGTGATPDYEDSNIVTVVDGLYATFIGDNTLSGSLVDALSNDEVWVEIEVDGVILSPRERIASVCFAQTAAGVEAGAIVTEMLDDDSVTSTKIQDKSIQFTDFGPNSAADGQVIKFDDFNGIWEAADDAGVKPGDAAGGDLTGTYPNPTLAPDSVAGGTIQDGSIDFSDIGQNGAAPLEVMKWDGAAWVARGDEGVTDHDDLTGLGDDDHTQYYRMDGVRTLAGAMNAGNNKIVNLGAGTVADNAVRFDQAVKVGDAAGGDLAGTYPNPTVDDGPGSGLDADRLDNVEGAGYLRSDTSDVFNEAGDNVDLRFEGEVDRVLLVLDASADSVGIGEGTPQGKLQVSGDEVRIGDSGVPGQADGDGDLYVEDVLEVDGDIEAGGDVDVVGGVFVDGQINAEAYSVVHDDFQIGDAAVGSDGDSEYMRIHAQSESWYLGVQNETTVGASDFYIGQASAEDGIFHIQNDGNVGIGTTSPGAMLQVKGDVVVGKGGSAPDGAEYVKIEADHDDWYVGVQNEATAGASDFFIGKGNLEDGTFHIENDGDVGMGTSSPAAELHVYRSSGNVQSKVEAEGGTASVSIDGVAGDVGVQFRESGTYRAAVGYSVARDDLYLTHGDSVVVKNGRLGIGTTSPGEELHVLASSGSARAKIESDAGAADLSIDGVSGDVGVEFRENGTYRAAVGYSVGRGDLYLTHGNSVVVKNGQVGIGTTSPSAGLEIGSDLGLKVTGPCYGTFPRPAYDSGWVTVAPGGSTTLVHNIGGNRSDYVVDLQFKNTSGPDSEWHNYLLGGSRDSGSYMGGNWSYLTESSIKLVRWSDDVVCGAMRVRIWTYQ